MAKLPFHIGTTTKPEEVRSEIVQRIHEEVAQLQAYCKIWQSSAGYVKNGERSIGSELKERVTDVVHPWPQIQNNPTGYREDGRFAKSFPLELPFGVGDLYQPRLRSDFSTMDWAQRQLQYYDGRCISSRRGNRFTWAIFNEALRESSHHTGRLVFKNMNESVLTKQELQELIEKRQGLVCKKSLPLDQIFQLRQ